MKTHARLVGLSTLLSVAALLGISAANRGVIAAESEPQETLAPAQQSARDAGNRDVRPGGEAIERDGPHGRSGAPGPEELKGRLERAMDELNDLRAAGKEQEALQKKRQVMELQEQLEERQRDAGRPRGPGPLERENFAPERPSDAPDMQRRLQHLQVAIDNLHAAGMHEPAERLSQEAEMMRRNLEARPPGARAPGVPGGELQQLRAEVQDLRQALRQLSARIDELTRERRAR